MIISETERFGAHRSLRMAGFKLIEDMESQEHSLFDLENDPGERRDVAAQHPERVREMLHALEQWRVANPRPAVRSTFEISDSERKRLRSLGYLEAGE